MIKRKDYKMNRREYMDKLRTALEGAEVSLRDEILSDYEAHFDEAASSGKTEEEICESLGSIEDLLAEIGIETGKAAMAGKSEVERDSDGMHRAESEREETGAVIPTSDGMHEGSEKQKDAQNAQGRKIDTMIVRGLSADVFVRRATGDKIGLDLRKTGSKKQELSFELEHHVEGNTLIAQVVRKDARSWFFQMVNSMGLELYVDVPDGMKRVEIHSASGDVSCTELDAGEIMLAAQSGDVKGRGLKAGKLEMTSMSGDIVCESGKAEVLSLSSMSGDVNLASSDAKTVTAKSTSGDVRLASVRSDDINVKSTSGDVLCDGKAEKVNISSVSGDTTMRLPAPVRATLSSVSGDVVASILGSRGYRARIATVSGDLAASFGREVQRGTRTMDVSFGEPDCEIEASSKSGDVTIKA